MDNFNRIISFVLGLIVVIVFLVVLSGRINLRERLLGQGQSKVTPSPTPTVVMGKYVSPTPSSRVAVGNTSTNSYNAKPTTPNSIPATGSPTLLIPFLASSLSIGIYLLKKTKS